MKAILSRGGKVRGYVQHIGNRKELLAPGGQLLGHYDKEKDQTYRPGAIFYGCGDQLLQLLTD